VPNAMIIYAAAIVLAFIGPIHSYLGEKILLGPLFRLEPKGILAVPRARAILRGAWHLTTLAWIALAFLLVRATGGDFENVAVAATLALSVITAIVCFWSVGPKHPGAIAFTICAALLIASRIA
jgi:hypothetical protein